MAGDTYWSSVSLLLAFDGTDASTTFIDTSNTGHSVTANGNAQLDTAQKKFGSASLLCDGTGDYLSIAHDSGLDLSSGDFTLECFIRLNATGKAQGIYTTRPTTDLKGVALRVQSTNKVVFFITGQSGTTTESTSTLSANTWYHIACTRSGSSIRLFIDGTLEKTTTSAETGTAGTAVSIGAEKTDGASPFDGWIDELRVTKGVARYTTTFTAPTAAFVNGPLFVGATSTQVNQAGTGFLPGYLIASAATEKHQATTAALTAIHKTAAVAAAQKNQASTGLIDLPMYSCFYGYWAATPGADYLSRAMTESPSGTRFTFATRLFIPSGAVTVGKTATICVWRSGNTPGYPTEEVAVYVTDVQTGIGFYAYADSATTWELYTSDAITEDEWHDIVVHYDSVQTTAEARATIYVDGVAQSVIGSTYPTQSRDAFGDLTSPYIVLNGYAMDGSADFCSRLAIADTLFISGRNVLPAACHDYCGGYGTADWHLRYSTATVGADTSGNGYDFTEAGTGEWIEPENDLCLQFTFPITLENRYRIDTGIPIVIRVKSTPTLPTLPITLGTYPVTATLPIVFRLRLTPTLPTLPVVIYGNQSATAGVGDFASWKPKCLINGVDMTAKLIGGGSVEFDEMAAPIASFSLLPTAGTVDPLAYVGQPVQLMLQFLEAGVVVAEYLVFTGLVSDPTWSVDDRVLTITATSDLQSVFDGMTKAEIDTQLAAFSPQYSEIVFGDTADLSGWEYAEALLSTVNAVVWQDVGGVIQVTSTLPKVSADFTYKDDGRFMGADISYPSRLDLINKRTIEIGYRHERLRSREVKVSFRPWQLVTPEIWLSCEGGWDLPQRDQIESAATGSGWYPISDIDYVDIWDNGQYLTRGCSGKHFYAAVYLSYETAEVLCSGANWTAARRWNQSVTETATITVGSSDSQAVAGVLADSESYGYESEYKNEDWENSLENEEYSTVGMTQMASGDWKLDLDTDRAVFEAAQEVAIAKARNDILKSHRGTTLTFQTVFQPQIDLSHTVHVDCAWVEAQGKVRRITHAWDMDTGDLTSEIAVALYRHNGSGLVIDTPVAATTKPVDPDETEPDTIIKLGMYIGGRDDKPPYDPEWVGYIVNMPPYETASTDPVDRAQVWARSPLNPAVQRYEPEGFHMKYPDIDSSYADPINAAAVADFDVAVPEDLLVLTA